MGHFQQIPSPGVLFRLSNGKGWRLIHALKSIIEAPQDGCVTVIPLSRRIEMEAFFNDVPCTGHQHCVAIRRVGAIR